MLENYEILIGDKKNKNNLELYFLQMKTRIEIICSLWIIPITIALIIFCEFGVTVTDKTKMLIMLSSLTVSFVAILLVVGVKTRKLRKSLDLLILES